MTLDTIKAAMPYSEKARKLYELILEFERINIKLNTRLKSYNAQLCKAGKTPLNIDYLPHLFPSADVYNTDEDLGSSNDSSMEELFSSENLETLHLQFITDMSYLNQLVMDNTLQYNALSIALQKELESQ